MAERNPIDKLPDADLVVWFEGEDGGSRELIVEAKLSPRTVRLGQTNTERHSPKEILSEGGADRTTVLQELQNDLKGIVGDETNLLRAAGAVAVRANREQLLQILKHPLVKAVRANRRLKPGSVA
jgi:hypothetical protein